MWLVTQCGQFPPGLLYNYSTKSCVSFPELRWVHIWIKDNKNKFFVSFFNGLEASLNVDGFLVSGSCQGNVCCLPQFDICVCNKEPSYDMSGRFVWCTGPLAFKTLFLCKFSNCIFVQNFFLYFYIFLSFERDNILHTGTFANIIGTIFCLLRKLQEMFTLGLKEQLH